MRYSYIISMISFSFVLCQPAFSDGCFVSNNYDHDVYAPDQKAVIAWDGSTETMIIATKLQSNAIADFGWLIPIRASEQPQVKLGDMQVFYDLSDFFKPIQPELMKYDSQSLSAEAEIPNIQVLEKKKLDVYDITVLKAKDAKALSDWLNKNSFKFAPSAKATLEFYTNQDFFFVAVKIDLSNKYKTEIANIGQSGLKLIEAVSNKIRDNYANPIDIQRVVLAILHNEQFGWSVSDYMSKADYEGLQKEYASKLNSAKIRSASIETICNVISDLKSGIAGPLKISFKASRPSFPLKISSVNKGSVKVTAYVLSHEPITDKSLTLKLQNCFQTTTGLRDKLSRYLPVSSAAWVSHLVFDGKSVAFKQDAYFEPIDQKRLNKTNDKAEALYRAIRDGDVEQTKILIADFPNMNEKILIITPLRYAVQSKQRAVAEYLINKGASVNPTKDSQEEPVLILAVMSGDINMLELLVNKGAEINSADALNVAIMMENMKAVRLFLKHGASVNLQGIGGNTPLHEAVEFGQIAAIKLLLAHGAKVDAKNGADETPLYSVVHFPFGDDIPKLLLDKGANPNTASGGKPLLNELATYQNESLAEMLLKKGANVNSKDAEGNTPLQIAVKANNHTMIKLLKKYGAK